jgi:hypothetical protein
MWSTSLFAHRPRRSDRPTRHPLCLRRTVLPMLGRGRHSSPARTTLYPRHRRSDKNVDRRFSRNGKPTAVGARRPWWWDWPRSLPAAGFVGPMSAIALGAVAACPSYAVCCGAPVLRSMIHSMSSPPMASAARRRPADRCLRAEGTEWRHGRTALRKSRAARDSSARHRRRLRIQRYHELHPAQRHRALHAVARRRGVRNGRDGCHGHSEEAYVPGGGSQVAVV